MIRLISWKNNLLILGLSLFGFVFFYPLLADSESRFLSYFPKDIKSLLPHNFLPDAYHVFEQSMLSKQAGKALQANSFQSREENTKLANFLLGDHLLRAGDGSFHSIKEKTPLSFVNPKLSYWAEHVCEFSRIPKKCAVESSWHAESNSIVGAGVDAPIGSVSRTNTDLQLERVLVEYGSNIYDSATWQIALGIAANAQLINTEKAKKLINNQNARLKKFLGKAVAHIVTEGQSNSQFQPINPQYAYNFNYLGPKWSLKDPLTKTKAYHSILSAPKDQVFEAGTTSWPDTQASSGENAWALLIAPIQSSLLVYGREPRHIPFEDPGLQNALDFIWGLKLMQSQVGGFYSRVDRISKAKQNISSLDISIRDNFSILAGLLNLSRVLRVLTKQNHLIERDRNKIASSLRLIRSILYGGGLTASGLVDFLKNDAFNRVAGVFYQNGSVVDHHFIGRKSSDDKDHLSLMTNSWGISVLGPKTIDKWFGIGTAYHMWQTSKLSEEYALFQVTGLSNQEHSTGERQKGKQVLAAVPIFSSLNTIAILLNYYHENKLGKALETESLQTEKNSLQALVLGLRNDHYLKNWNNLPGGIHPKYQSSIEPDQLGFLYSSRRSSRKEGWNNNPFVSSVASAWAMMWAFNFNPFSPYGAIDSRVVELIDSETKRINEDRVAPEGGAITIVNDIFNEQDLHDSEITVDFIDANGDKINPLNRIKKGSYGRFIIPEAALKLQVSYILEGQEQQSIACVQDLDSRTRLLFDQDPRRILLRAIKSNASGTGSCQLEKDGLIREDFL